MAQRFLRDSDYEDQIRAELMAVIDSTTDSAQLRQAEQKALAQMKKYLSSRYDIGLIFRCIPPDEQDDRDAFIVMTLVDMTLYHIWSKERGKMPQIRNDRYQDALDWLKSVGNGELISDLPTLSDTDVCGGFQIYSMHAPNNHKY